MACMRSIPNMANLRSMYIFLTENSVLFGAAECNFQYYHMSHIFCLTEYIYSHVYLVWSLHELSNYFMVSLYLKIETRKSVSIGHECPASSNRIWSLDTVALILWLKTLTLKRHVPIPGKYAKIWFSAPFIHLKCALPLRRKPHMKFGHRSTYTLAVTNLTQNLKPEIDYVPKPGRYAKIWLAAPPIHLKCALPLWSL